MSAAAKKRVALAVSRAQKARWAAYRKAKAAKANTRNKPAPPARKSISKPRPVESKSRPGTREAQIEKVAGQE